MANARAVIVGGKIRLYISVHIPICEQLESMTALDACLKKIAHSVDSS